MLPRERKPAGLTILEQTAGARPLRSGPARRPVRVNAQSSRRPPKAQTGGFQRRDIGGLPRPVRAAACLRRREAESSALHQNPALQARRRSCSAPVRRFHRVPTQLHAQPAADPERCSERGDGNRCRIPQEAQGVGGVRRNDRVPIREECAHASRARHSMRRAHLSDCERCRRAQWGPVAGQSTVDDRCIEGARVCHRQEARVQRHITARASLRCALRSRFDGGSSEHQRCQSGSSRAHLP